MSATAPHRCGGSVRTCPLRHLGDLLNAGTDQTFFNGDIAALITATPCLLFAGSFASAFVGHEVATSSTVAHLVVQRPSIASHRCCQSMRHHLDIPRSWRGMSIHLRHAELIHHSVEILRMCTKDNLKRLVDNS